MKKINVKNLDEIKPALSKYLKTMKTKQTENIEIVFGQSNVKFKVKKI